MQGLNRSSGLSRTWPPFAAAPLLAARLHEHVDADAMLLAALNANGLSVRFNLEYLLRAVELARIARVPLATYPPSVGFTLQVSNPETRRYIIPRDRRYDKTIE